VPVSCQKEKVVSVNSIAGFSPKVTVLPLKLGGPKMGAGGNSTVTSPLPFNVPVAEGIPAKTPFVALPGIQSRIWLVTALNVRLIRPDAPIV
jgi:hypothetical protein